MNSPFFAGEPKCSPDAHFPATKWKRLQKLMAAWRAARDRGVSLSAADQAELNDLVNAELKAAIARTRDMAPK